MITRGVRVLARMAAERHVRLGRDLGGVRSSSSKLGSFRAHRLAFMHVIVGFIE